MKYIKITLLTGIILFFSSCSSNTDLKLPFSLNENEEVFIGEFVDLIWEEAPYYRFKSENGDTLEIFLPEELGSPLDEGYAPSQLYTIVYKNEVSQRDKGEETSVMKVLVYCETKTKNKPDNVDEKVFYQTEEVIQRKKITTTKVSNSEDGRTEVQNVEEVEPVNNKPLTFNEVQIALLDGSAKKCEVMLGAPDKSSGLYSYNKQVYIYKNKVEDGGRIKHLVIMLRDGKRVENMKAVVDGERAYYGIHYVVINGDGYSSNSSSFE